MGYACLTVGKHNDKLYPMKKIWITSFAFVALLGILNCALLEPAFACKDEATHSEQSGDSDCCFIHCSMHHQWVVSSAALLNHNILNLHHAFSAAFSFTPDPPLGSIFRPPVVL